MCECFLVICCYVLLCNALSIFRYYILCHVPPLICCHVLNFVFTRRNVKTLKVSAESLFWAALVSAVIAPTVISWLEREPRGILWETNDLTFGVAAIVVALYGFAIVLVKAVDLKEVNDEMV